MNEKTLSFEVKALSTLLVNAGETISKFKTLFTLNVYEEKETKHRNVDPG